MGRALGRALDLPTKVLNDAEVAGAGVVTGTNRLPGLGFGASPFG